MKILKEQIMASDLNLLLMGSGDSDPILAENTIINLDSSMTAAEIQALIDAQPMNLGGYTLTFQFADGTYTLNNTLYFKYFFSGEINIFGNIADNSLSNTKNVNLVFGATHGIYLQNTRCTISVKYLAIQHSGSAGKSAIRFNNAIGDNYAHYNFIQGNSIAVGEGITAVECFLYCDSNSFTSNYVAIYSYISFVNVSNCESVTVLPGYGLLASSGGVISKNGTTPTGTTANQLTSVGGVVR